MLSPVRWPMLLSIGVAIVTLLMKGTAYFLTDSVGLLSDTLESFVNLGAAVTAYICLWYAARPVDLNHTYGHEKIEYFSSGLEGVLILVAAFGIAWYAVLRIFKGEGPQSLEIGTILALAAAALNGLVAQILLRAGKKHQSIVLEADGHHLMTDVYTSLGVVAGLVLVWLTGWVILDPLAALVMAGNIVWTALQLIDRSFRGLMDHALPDHEIATIRKVIRECLQPSTHFHALRTRQAGARRFIDFHLLVPGSWSVSQAHDLGEKIEEKLIETFPTSEVTVHPEPIEASRSWEDSILLDQEPKTEVL